MQTEQNQAVTMYPLFFDPIYKRVHFEKRDGKEKIGYRDEEWGVRLEENGDVTFSIYAPSAESVEVAGISGSMSREHISLEKDEKGLFSKRVSGIAPGFHYHNWFVDGVQVVNPKASLTFV